MADQLAEKILRLDSMTLRGIGSYYDGAELKFRPLTVLCGTNGSGKSTWFNRLAMLQRSMDRLNLTAERRVCQSGGRLALVSL
jgi:predicted ATPase